MATNPALQSHHNEDLASHKFQYFLQESILTIYRAFY
jgi:hypothetical protein